MPEDRIDRFERIIEKVIHSQESLVDSQRVLLDSQKGIVESQKGLIDSHKRLSEAQAATDEKLNILIDTVDKIIRSRPQ